MKPEQIHSRLGFLQMTNTKLIFTHAKVTFFYTNNQGNVLPNLQTCRVTFAAFPATTGETTQYACSWVAPQDQFCRETGRQKAEARLLRRGNRYKRELLIHSDQNENFWHSIFVDAANYGPCRWEIIDISFNRQQSPVPCAAIAP